MDLAGKLFASNGKKYAWIAYVGDDPRWAIRAVDVSTGHTVVFHRNDWVEIMAQIAPRVRLAV